MADRRPLCGHCERGIKPCAPCCRHSGWVHRDTGRHDCDEGGKMAYPWRRLESWERALPVPGSG